MNDFRIKVFLSVAQNLSFTKASADLHISQPAISNHIKEIESMYKVQLFERIKNSIRLTSAGRLFLKHAEQINHKYGELEFEMSLAGENNLGKLIIGASATIADYILPSIMATYNSKFPDVELSLVSGDTTQIEELVFEHKVDIGLIEGFLSEGKFKFSFLGNDELVLVKSYDNKKIGREVSIQELTKIPLVLNKNGSDILEIITDVLKSKGIEYTDLNVIAQLDSIESIKRFILNEKSCAILPMSAIASQLLRNELSIVEILDLKFYRELLFIFPLDNLQSDSLIDSSAEIAKNFARFVKRALE